MPGMSKLKKPDAPLCRALATLVVLLAAAALLLTKFVHCRADEQQATDWILNDCLK